MKIENAAKVKALLDQREHLDAIKADIGNSCDILIRGNSTAAYVQIAKDDEMYTKLLKVITAAIAAIDTELETM